MCAINGYNFKDTELVHAMNRATAHRGPDGSGIFFDDGITLGHNRLSIIDLSHAADQPMKNNKGTLILVFNGEIYNFKELKEELKSSYHFRTESDTEVILAAYERWGKKCVEKFNGMFAFAIWDKVRRELFLARDHVGIKPLYYFHDGKTFVFSSEIKGILEHETIPRVLNRDAFSIYLRTLYTPEPLTMFKDIYKFPKASYGILKDGQLEIKKYWDPTFGNYLTDSPADIEEMLRGHIRTAVSRQLVSDKPLGIYLSGGIDSNVVLHHVMELKGHADTFSVGFDLGKDEEREKFNHDAMLAKQVAALYGTTHHEILMPASDMIPAFEKRIFHLDEPIGNTTVVPQIILAEFAKKHVDVVLGGDGGDELFGGYDRYQLSNAARMYQKLPIAMRTLAEKRGGRFEKLNTKPGIDQYALFMFQKDSILDRVVEKKYFDHGAARRFFTERYFTGREEMRPEELLMDIDRKTWLVDDALVRSDKTAMAWGLEERVPLLDKEIVEFALRIPVSQKVDFWRTKKILKNAYRGRLPEFLFQQPKRGWHSPAAKWIRRKGIHERVSEYLSADYHVDTAALFRWDDLRAVLNGHLDKSKYNLIVLWTILAFRVWAKQYNVKL